MENLAAYLGLVLVCVRLDGNLISGRRLDETGQGHALLGGQPREFKAKMEAVGVANGGIQQQRRVAGKLDFHCLPHGECAGDDGSYSTRAYGCASSMEDLSVAANNMD